MASALFFSHTLIALFVVIVIAFAKSMGRVFSFRRRFHMSVCVFVRTKQKHTVERSLTLN